jgi:hypothetical protein
MHQFVRLSEQMPKTGITGKDAQLTIQKKLQAFFHVAQTTSSCLNSVPGKIIIQAFSLRAKMQTRISPINPNSICDPQKERGL